MTIPMNTLMTKLALTDERLDLFTRRVPGAISLRSWLAGRWSILFSHPEDFAQEQVETDRWLSVLSESFRGNGIAPVALLRADSEGDRSWLGRMAAACRDCAAMLSLEQLKWATLANFATSALRAEISAGGARFAMIVDSELRCRHTLKYRLRSELPSPLDLIGWAVAARKRHQSMGDTRDLSFPIQTGWTSAPHCHAAHGCRG